jgi:hypothetical protein
MVREDVKKDQIRVKNMWARQTEVKRVKSRKKKG